jgi:predicted neutral ceramidase superfamily lipid hydrolase
LGYASRKTYRKVSTTKPSIFIVAAITVALSIFLLGGGIFDILEKPLVVIGYSSRVIFFYPYSISEQTILESLTVMVLYSIGAAGLLLMYQSTKYAYKPRQATILLLAGAVFLFIAYISIETTLYWKFSFKSSSS